MENLGIIAFFVVVFLVAAIALAWGKAQMDGNARHY